MSSIDTNVKNLHSKWDENEGLGVLEWLTRVDYGAQQSDYFSRRENGTGQWLLNHRDFQSWVETSGKTLFCPGIPGAGKTIMTSTVVDNIVTRFSKDEDVGIAYVYCDFKRQDDQSALNLLSSMLKQLCRGRPSLPDFMRVFHDKHKKHQTRPSLGEIMKNLHSVAAMYSRVFIIVDALDECQSSDGCREQFLRNIFSLQNKVQSNIFATSRHVHEIEEQFSGSTSLQIRAMDEDVHAYLASQIYKLPPFVRRDVGLQNRIKTTIAKTVDGM